MYPVVDTVEQLDNLAAQQKLSTIARVLNVADYVTPDGAHEVMVNAKALGTRGQVYDLTLDFSPKTAGQKNLLLKDLKPGAIYRVEGSCWVFDGEPICLVDPAYRRLVLAADVVDSAFNHPNACA